MNFVHGNFYLYDITALFSRINTYNPFQRPIDRGKVDLIKESLMREKKEKSLSEIIQTGIIHIGSHKNIHYIIDGQHRFQAYRELKEPRNILIQFWDYSTIEEMQRKFVEINSNTPIEEYVINQVPQKSAYDTVIEHIQSEYKNYIKSSDKPIFPNINMEMFRKIIHMIPELKHSTKETAIDDFNKYNRNCFEELRRNKKEKDRYHKCLNENIPFYINRSVIDLYNLKLQNDKLI